MIEAIYCLSRPEREDRRQRLIPHLDRAKAMGVLPPLDVIWWSKPLREDVFMPSSFGAEVGYWAATVAHRLMLEDAWNNRYDEVMILEDDADPLECFFTGFVRFMATIRAAYPDWLALWLGCHSRRPGIKYPDGVSLNRGCLGCHAYIVNRHGIWRLLDHLFVQHRLIVDHAFNSMMMGDACVYSPEPMMIGTINAPSDNYNSK